MAKPSAAGRAPISSRAAWAMARAIGCSEPSSSAPTRRSTSVAVLARRRRDLDERHLAGRHRAGLVEDDRVDPAGRLQHLGPLDQDAHLGAPAGADEQCGGRGQAERAGAGDDQHGDGRGEGDVGAGAVGEPEAEGRDRQADHDRHEHGRDAIGQPLHRALPDWASRRPAGHLRQGRVGADAGGPHHEPAAGVDGRAGDVVAGPDLDRHALAGEQRCVDRRRCPPRRRRRWRCARPGGPRTGRRRGARAIGTRRSAPSSPSIAASLAPSSEQCAQRGTGAALGARLEVTAGEDERGDHRGRPRGRCDRRPRPARSPGRRHPHAVVAGAQEEQGDTATSRTRPACRPRSSVSIVAAPWRRLIHAARWKGQPPQSTTGVARAQRQPLPVVELQRRNHRQQQHRQRQDGRGDKSMAQAGDLDRARRRHRRRPGHRADCAP